MYLEVRYIIIVSDKEKLKEEYMVLKRDFFEMKIVLDSVEREKS